MNQFRPLKQHLSSHSLAGNPKAQFMSHLPGQTARGIRLPSLKCKDCHQAAHDKVQAYLRAHVLAYELHCLLSITMNIEDGEGLLYRPRVDVLTVFIFDRWFDLCRIPTIMSALYRCDLIPKERERRKVKVVNITMTMPGPLLSNPLHWTM